LSDDRAAWARLLSASAEEGAGHPQRICELCVDQLDVTGAGISMVTATGNRGVVCATDDIARTVEEQQLTFGEGPCVDAVATGSPVLIADLREPDLTQDRWPVFLERAEAAGVRALFAFPLRIGAISVGALDLYRRTAGRLPADQLAGALMAADAAALALLDLDDHGILAAEALDGGSLGQLQIHQATGMVRVQLGVSTEVAFLSLRARAFASGRRLADLAADVVARRERFSKDDT
jgi:hypothetical protein